MKKLLLNGNNLENAWEILGDYAGLYGDNGSDPDGNCWLPGNQDNIPADLAATVVSEGLGEMVEVRMANDDAMINFLDLNPPADNEIDDEYAERMRDRADEKQLAWAHYGAYGAGDSHWVFVKE